MEYKYSTKNFYSPSTVIGVEPDIEKDPVEQSDGALCEQLASTIPNFPTELLDFYKTKPHDREIYLDSGWRLLSLQGIVERYKAVCNDSNNIIDIGLRYLGMGYVKVVAYNLTHNYYFYRDDGGSSGIDRQYNYNRIKNMANTLSKDSGFTFTAFLDQARGELDEHKSLF